MKTEANPWSAIAKPSMGQVNKRRVDAELVWNFFWAKTASGSLQLTFDYGETVVCGKLPNLRGVAVTNHAIVDGGQRLIFELQDAQLQEPFTQFCRDIVESTRAAQAEQAALDNAIRRAWRWHRLLKAGELGLSEAEEKGLVGELLVLEGLLGLLDGESALAAWRGPLDAPKDFEHGHIAVEVKARRAGAHARVAISSADQLDVGAFGALYLHVIELISGEGSDSFTLNDLVERLRERVQISSEQALEEFENKLLAAGAGLGSESRQWRVADQATYRVEGDFPRLLLDNVPAGVNKVKYELELHGLAHFRVENSEALKRLAQGE